MSDHSASVGGVGGPDPGLRVLLVTAVVGGGVGRHVRQLAEGLVRRGHRVGVACPPEVAAGLDLAATGAQLVPLRLGSGPGDGLPVRALLRLRAALAGVDVVHAHGIRAGAAAALALPASGPALVVTSHNAPPGGAAGLVYAVLERLACRRADLVLGVSPDLVARARARSTRATDLATVPADTAIPPTRPERVAARAALRRELGVEESATLVLAAGRLAAQKRMAALVAAYQAVVRQGRAGAPPVLVIVGEGPLETELRALAAQGPGEVRLLGRRDDVPGLLAAADLVVSASVWEGQPLVLQEALAAGAPVVATDVGGSGLVLGGAGVLVPGEEGLVVTALTEVIGALLDDPARRRELGERALARARRLPSTQDALDAVEDSYAQVLAGRGRS